VAIIGKKLTFIAIASLWIGLSNWVSYPVAADVVSTKNDQSKNYNKAKFLFSRHFNKDFNSEWRDDWHQLGYRYYQDGSFWHIEAIDDAAVLGGGHYVFNPGASGNDLVQAPHRYFDGKTKPLALKIFASPQLMSISWNTHHRREIDMVHHAPSMMMALTEAWVETTKQGSLIQLHGFTPLKRKTASGKASLIIVSEGVDKPSKKHKVLTACFNRLWPATLYPLEVTELGGRANVMARKLALEEKHTLFHVELSTDFRKNLQNNYKDNEQFIRCINEVLG
jgi:hypothetical protein